MGLEISPEPTAEERAAIAAAFAARPRQPGSESVWWREGVLEAVDGDGDAESAAYVVAEPRSSRGAARA